MNNMIFLTIKIPSLDIYTFNNWIVRLIMFTLCVRVNNIGHYNQMQIDCVYIVCVNNPDHCNRVHIDYVYMLCVLLTRSFDTVPSSYTSPKICVCVRTMDAKYVHVTLANACICLHDAFECAHDLLLNAISIYFRTKTTFWEWMG